MHIRSLDLKGFMCHSATHLDLPCNGIVTVSGLNGSGKSSLMEAVSFGLWGKTLRGTDPWAGNSGKVSVTTDQVTAERSKVKGKAALTWHLEGSLPETFETVTKAQDRLEQVIGSFESWRRTCVFSSSDAMLFSTATDGERKRLLESLLDLTRFDDALATCREQFRVQSDLLVSADQRLGIAAERLAAAERALESARNIRNNTSSRMTDDEVSKLQESLEGLRKRISEGEMFIQQRRGSLRTLDSKSAEARAELHAAQKKQDLLSKGTCPTCSQVIGAELSASLKVTVDIAQARAESLAEEGRQLVSLAEAEISELSEEQDAFRRQVQSLESSVRTYKENLRWIESVDQEIGTAEQAKREALENRDQAAKQRLEAGKDLPVLQACETVLGLRGVRAQLLGKLLGGLENAANAYLVRISGPGFRVQLKPFSEKKSGGITDAISLEVTGPGNGKGYRASSGGERRRMDVALLLALAEVAASSRGAVPGTLFFDEVFDSLDDDGISAVADILMDLAKDRVVLVISHSRDLTAKLPGKHIWVDSGRLTL